MIESMLKKLIKAENEAMMSFFEEKSIEAQLPIDVMGHVILSISKIYFHPIINPNGKMEICLKQEPLSVEDALEIPFDEMMDRRLLRRDHNSIGSCHHCIHNEYNPKTEEWIRECKFALRTYQLKDNPHDDNAKWFCPYYDTYDDSDSQIENLFNMYMEGRKND